MTKDNAPVDGDHHSPHPQVTLGLRVLGIAIAALIVTYIVLIPLGIIAKDNRIGLAEVGLFVVSLLFSTGLIEQIQDFTFGPGGFSIRLKKLQTQTNSLRLQVKALQLVVSGLLTGFEVEKLEGLSREGPFLVTFHNDMLLELKHLDALRFVKPLQEGGLNRIRERDGSGATFDLKQYVAITTEGRTFMDCRRDVLQEKPSR